MTSANTANRSVRSGECCGSVRPASHTRLIEAMTPGMAAPAGEPERLHLHTATGFACPIGLGVATWVATLAVLADKDPRWQMRRRTGSRQS